MAAQRAAPTKEKTMEHCTHDGRAFLNPCPVCALRQAEKERDEARAVADQAKDTIAVLKEQLDELRSALKRT